MLTTFKVLGLIPKAIYRVLIFGNLHGPQRSLRLRLMGLSIILQEFSHSSKWRRIDPIMTVKKKLRNLQSPSHPIAAENFLNQKHKMTNLPTDQHYTIPRALL